jgi:hypothetical protein
MIFTRSTARTGRVRLAMQRFHSCCCAAVNWILAALGMTLTSGAATGFTLFQTKVTDFQANVQRNLIPTHSGDSESPSGAKAEQ